MRIVEAVTAGAGFLAAGIILQSGGKVYELTTGTGVWTAAAIGMAWGSGAYAIAGITTALVLVALFGPGFIKKKMGWDRNDIREDRVETPAAPTGKAMPGAKGER